jgi:hypothetical protein
MNRARYWGLLIIRRYFGTIEQMVNAVVVDIPDKSGLITNEAAPQTDEL